MRRFAVVLLIALLAAPAAAAEKRTIDLEKEVVILVNDGLPESVALGAYYAKKRAIPPTQICHVRTIADEVIAWPAFRKDILEPVRAFLKTRPTVLYLVPVWGIPVKTSEEKPENDGKAGADTLSQFVTGRDYACVDRELELVHQEHELEGWLPSKLFGLRRHPSPQDKVLIVSRLDGPSPEAARALVDNALYGEAYGIGGKALVDVRGLDKGTDGYADCDRRMRALAPVFEKAGIDFELDEKPEVVDLATRPALGHYWGWYTGNVLCSKDEWRFVRGAVGSHLHSFAAAALRKKDQTWTGPLVAHGVTGTFGTVYEPLITGFPDGTTFFERFLEGYTFGESLELANQMTSWQAVFVGDPLYAPYAEGMKEAQAKNRKFCEEVPASLTAALDSGDVAKAGDVIQALDALGAVYEGAKDGSFLVREARSRIAAPDRKAKGKIEELLKAIAEARTALRGDDAKKALAAAKRAVDLSPASADANLVHGIALTLAGNAKAAVPALELAARIDRTPEVTAWLDRAQGRFEAARKAFPHDHQLAADAARALLAAKDAKGAVALLDKAVADLPTTFAEERGLLACYEQLLAALQAENDKVRTKDLAELVSDLKSGRVKATPRDKAAPIEDALEEAQKASPEKLADLPTFGKPKPGLPRVRLANGSASSEIDVLIVGPVVLRATLKPGKKAEAELLPGTYRVLVKVADKAKPRAFFREQRIDASTSYAIALDEKLALTKPAD